MFACLSMNRSCVSVEMDKVQHLDAVQRMRSELERQNVEEKKLLEETEGDGSLMFDPDDGKSVRVDPDLSSRRAEPVVEPLIAEDPDIAGSQEEDSAIHPSFIHDLENLGEVTQPFDASLTTDD